MTGNLLTNRGPSLLSRTKTEETKREEKGVRGGLLYPQGGEIIRRFAIVFMRGKEEGRGRGRGKANDRAEHYRLIQKYTRGTDKERGENINY
jgi:hypothetical protein